MRVIAGKYKGRKLETPVDYSVRPTADKVKEAMFSILMGKIRESRFLDLFAGTGSIGIEALSRGASSCVFGDSSRESIKLIKKNIELCGAGDAATVVSGDFRKVLDAQDDKFDIIFLDPPYGRGFIEPSFESISKLSLLNDEGLIIAEHRRDEELPEELYGLKKLKERKYGRIVLSIYY